MGGLIQDSGQRHHVNISRYERLYDTKPQASASTGNNRNLLVRNTFAIHCVFGGFSWFGD
jgi:hypothetical protein